MFQEKGKFEKVIIYMMLVSQYFKVRINSCNIFLFYMNFFKDKIRKYIKIIFFIFIIMEI